MLKVKDRPLGSTDQRRLQTIRTFELSHERFKSLKILTKQLLAATPTLASLRSNGPSAADVHLRGEPAPVWTQMMETLFGPSEDQLRLVKCENCGILTRETNGKAGVTHKLNCEMLRKSGLGSGKKFGPFLGLVDSASKKRASSEISLDSSSFPNKKKRTTADHIALMEALSQRSDTLGINLGSEEVDLTTMTKKELKKTLAAMERIEREKQRAEKRRKKKEEEESNRKMLKKFSGRIKGGPVNVNEQCGVLIPPSDTPCARSLTCKTHSMGAKRSVQGRRAPYDVLLNEWQKKHNPNWGDRKVVTPRVGPGIEPAQSKKKKREIAVVSAVASSGFVVTPNNSSAGQMNSTKNNYNPNPPSKSTPLNQTPQKKEKLSTPQPGNPKSAAKSQVQPASAHSRQRKEGPSRASHQTHDKINEAKLLGEIDEDFHLRIEPRARKLKAADPAEGQGGSTQASGVQEEEDDDGQGPSDTEVELIVKALAIHQSNHPIVQNGLAQQKMGSAWLHPQWSKFGRFGVKEAFKEAFKS